MPTIESLKSRYPKAETFRFGDGPELSALLLTLVRSGKKRATCSVMSEIESGEKPSPVVGQKDIALTWQGTPALVIETLELVPCSFETMTEEMALAEGENTDLAGWRRDHEGYFKRQGIFAPDMGLLWERFAVIEDFGA